MKNTKKTLFQSVLALILCFSMLLGTTYAWFTDSVTSQNNIIKTGSLDLKVYWSEDLSAWKDVEAEGTIFDYDKWEPGYTEVRYVKIVNNGNLAFKYATRILPLGLVGPLADVIDVYYAENPTAPIDKRTDLTTPVGTLTEVLAGNLDTDGELLVGEEIVVAIALKMQETAGNDYQGLSIGDSFSIQIVATQLASESDAFGPDYDTDSIFPDLPVNQTASAAVETNAEGITTASANLDSGNGVSAQLPTGVKTNAGTTKVTLTVTELKESNANITVNEDEETASIDVHIEGVSKDNTTPIPVTIEGLLPVGMNGGNFDLYHVENGMTNLMACVDTLTAHNQFTYDPATGDVTIYLATFSEVPIVVNRKNVWQGEYDISWYNADLTFMSIYNADQFAGFGAMVGGMARDEKGELIPANSFKGKTIVLKADLDFGGSANTADGEGNVRYPVGYYNDEGTYKKSNIAVTSGFRNFEGTFDGNGNVIANVYQNTWEMKGDNNYYPASEQRYRDGMGLFGRVYGGTVRNLIVENFQSDGEYTTTGVIAAYADSTAEKAAYFHHISIFDCNPRVYNIGNGGIVGCVGWYAKEENQMKTTFENITVDNSNKISSLWGSWDTACGGIVGQYYPTSGQSSANYPKNAGITLRNCHVAAQIDVFNDVCANYQYYAYRYAGMLIGSVRENVTIGGHEYPNMEGITVDEKKGCTVHFGDWNDYYYCELVANSLASYTHDHQMSRLEQVTSVDLKNKKVTSLAGQTTAIPTEGRVNYVVVKAKDANGKWLHGDGTAYATCYHFVNGVQHFHDKADADNPNIYETVNGAEVLKEDKTLVYREFSQLITGYGWGVTSKGVGEMAGVTILDRTEANSVKKFAANTGYSSRVYKTGDVITAGDLFVAVKDLDIDINPLTVQITVSPRATDANSTASASVTIDKTNWENSTITLKGHGAADITITDYYYSKPVTVSIVINNASDDMSFDNVEEHQNNTGTSESIPGLPGATYKYGSVVKGTDGNTYVRLTYPGGNDNIPRMGITNLAYNGTDVVIEADLMIENGFDLTKPFSLIKLYGTTDNFAKANINKTLSWKLLHLYGDGNGGMFLGDSVNENNPVSIATVKAGEWFHVKIVCNMKDPATHADGTPYMNELTGDHAMQYIGTKDIYVNGKLVLEGAPLGAYPLPDIDHPDTPKWVDDDCSTLDVTSIVFGEWSARAAGSSLCIDNYQFRTDLSSVGFDNYPTGEYQYNYRFDDGVEFYAWQEGNPITIVKDETDEYGKSPDDPYVKLKFTRSGDSTTDAYIDVPNTTKPGESFIIKASFNFRELNIPYTTVHADLIKLMGVNAASGVPILRVTIDETTRKVRFNLSSSTFDLYDRDSGWVDVAIVCDMTTGQMTVIINDGDASRNGMTATHNISTKEYTIDPSQFALNKVRLCQLYPDEVGGVIALDNYSFETYVPNNNDVDFEDYELANYDATHNSQGNERPLQNGAYIDRGTIVEVDGNKYLQLNYNYVKQSELVTENRDALVAKYTEEYNALKDEEKAKYTSQDAYVSGKLSTHPRTANDPMFRLPVNTVVGEDTVVSFDFKVNNGFVISEEFQSHFFRVTGNWLNTDGTTSPAAYLLLINKDKETNNPIMSVPGGSWKLDLTTVYNKWVHVDIVYKMSERIVVTRNGEDVECFGALDLYVDGELVLSNVRITNDAAIGTSSLKGHDITEITFGNYGTYATGSIGIDNVKVAAYEPTSEFEINFDDFDGSNNSYGVTLGSAAYVQDGVAVLPYTYNTIYQSLYEERYSSLLAKYKEEWNSLSADEQAAESQEAYADRMAIHDIIHGDDGTRSQNDPAIHIPITHGMGNDAVIEFDVKISNPFTAAQDDQVTALIKLHTKKGNTEETNESCALLYVKQIGDQIRIADAKDGIGGTTVAILEPGAESIHIKIVLQMSQGLKKTFVNGKLATTAAGGVEIWSNTDFANSTIYNIRFGNWGSSFDGDIYIDNFTFTEVAP